MKKIDELILVLFGVSSVFLLLINLPTDLLTRLTILYYLSILMFIASFVYFMGIVYRLKKSKQKLPLALKSLSLLSFIGTISVLQAILPMQNPAIAVALVLFYSAVFLFTAVRGGR